MSSRIICILLLVISSELVSCVRLAARRGGSRQTDAIDRRTRSISNRHQGTSSSSPSSSSSSSSLDSVQSDERGSTGGTSTREILRMKQLVMHSRNKIVDFERGRHMDASDEAAQQITTGPADNDTLQQYAQRNCTACLMREEAKLGRIERIKEDLLNKLGFKNAPNSTSKDAPPIVPNLQGILVKWGFNADNTLTADAAMAADEAYDARTRDRADLRPEDYEAKTERVYAFATKPPTFLGLSDELTTDGVYFRFSSDTMNNHVDHAFLHVHVNRPATSSLGVQDTVTTLKMDVYLIESRDGKKTLVDTKHFKRNLRIDSGHWEKLNVTKQVRHWFQKPEKNYGLLVRVDYEGENLANMPTDITIKGDNQIYLDIVTKEGARSRSKRSTVKLDCQEKDNETRCCRYPLVLDFESFGWDWVIAPKKYLAYYCSGECPFRHLQRYLHTHLVQQSNPRGNAGPCCYPTQMAPILMVYFNENKEVLVSKVPGMVVTRCGCA